MTGPTRAQLVRLHATLGDLGVTDRADKLRLLAGVIYRPITTTTDLTYAECRVALDTLQSIAQRDDPAAAVARLMAVAL